jgi:pyruvate dehydrogenase E2 component (dihydrolipoamide acetyltransferase)
MATSVVMPALEMAQETGKLLSWRKKEGESVKKGEALLEIETDKAVVEIEAAADGVLAGVKAQAGAVVPVGQTIAWLVQPGEAPPAEAGPAQTGRRSESAPAQQAAAASAAPAAAAGARTALISPKARRLAKEHGLDLSTLTGTGPDGEILAADVLASAESRRAPAFAAPSAAAAPAMAAPSNAVPESLSSIGRLMAERTTQSWTTVPHFFVTREIDATALVVLREKLVPTIEKSHGVKPTHTDLLVAIVARVLRQHPRMNASWTGSAIKVNPDVNVALAMAVNDGVVTAVIPRADTATIADIATRRRGVTERARANRLQPSDIAGATFTISNLGMYHVDHFTAIIVPPQAGILAVGAITDRVVPMSGALLGIGVRPTMTMTLSCDHRVVDGARGAAFLNDVVDAVMSPGRHIS